MLIDRKSQKQYMKVKKKRKSMIKNIKFIKSKVSTK